MNVNACFIEHADVLWTVRFAWLTHLIWCTDGARLRRFLYISNDIKFDLPRSATRKFFQIDTVKCERNRGKTRMEEKKQSFTRLLQMLTLFVSMAFRRRLLRTNVRFDTGLSECIHITCTYRICISYTCSRITVHRRAPAIADSCTFFATHTHTAYKYVKYPMHAYIACIGMAKMSYFMMMMLMMMCLSVEHYHPMPPRVGETVWKRHTAANVLIVAAAVCVCLCVYQKPKLN